MLTFLGLDLKDNLLKLLYIVVEGSVFQKSDPSYNYNAKKLLFKK